MGRAGLCTIAFKTRPLFDVVSIASDVGASTLEIWGQPPHVDYPLDMTALESVRSAAERKGLAFSVFGSYFQPGKTVAFNGVVLTVDNQVAAAEALGASFIRVWAGSKNPVEVTAKEKAKWYDEIRRFACAAAEAGIDTVLERHTGSLTHGWDAPARVLAEIDHPHVFLNYQIAYPMPTREYRVRSVEDYTRLLPLSRHAHLQNYRETSDGSLVRTLLDRGIVDYGRLGLVARRSGYGGSFMVEFPAEIREGMTAMEAVASDIAYIESLALSGPETE